MLVLKTQIYLYCDTTIKKNYNAGEIRGPTLDPPLVRASRIAGAPVLPCFICFYLTCSSASYLKALISTVAQNVL